MRKEELEKELARVVALKKQVEQSIDYNIKGRIRCEMAQGKYPQYYLYTEDEQKKYPRGRYLKSEDRELARQILQRDYDLQMLRILERDERALQRKLKEFEEISIVDVYEKMPKAKQILVNPYIKPNEEFIDEWKKSDLDYKNTYPIENGYITENGEKVRSKSEKMIADKLYYMKIPYKYEAALRLKGNQLIFPDFSLLNVKKRKTIYLEHFGMMDNEEYCRKALEKIEIYENNNIFVGDTLLITYESSIKGINLKQIEKYIERYLQ